MRNNDSYLLEQAYRKIYESEYESDDERDYYADKYMDMGYDDYNKEYRGETPMQDDDSSNLIEDLKNALKNGANFASFMYKSKTTGDTSIFNVNLNVDYQRAKEEDLQKVRQYEPVDSLEQEAKESILNPKERKVIKGDPYENLGKGIKLNKNTGALHIIGWVENKEVMARGEMEKKEVKSRPLTIAKNNLMRKLELKSMGPLRKIRNFILEPENISGLRIKGKVIEFQY